MWDYKVITLIIIIIIIHLISLYKYITNPII